MRTAEDIRVCTGCGLPKTENVLALLGAAAYLEAGGYH